MHYLEGRNQPRNGSISMLDQVSDVLSDVKLRLFVFLTRILDG